MNADAPLLSIIVPVGPGDDAWCGLLERLDAFPAPCQIVLSTCEPLAWRNARRDGSDRDMVTVQGPPGRAAQLNRGIAAARADCLWLVHADSRPDAATMEAAAGFAEMCRIRPSTLGWFPLAFSADGPPLAMLNAHGANLRSRLLKMPFGDQAWLVSRTLFDRVGGFDETFGRGEDLDFLVRARRAGAHLKRLHPPIRTSARRYREQGWLRTTHAHLWLTLRLWLRARRRAGRRMPGNESSRIRKT
ncbi:MAG: hypothetical protein R6V61_01320 [Wenzhouxiangellaceae bacterium]